MAEAEIERIRKAEKIEFAERVAKAMNDLRSSNVFFILQKAYPEHADEWEWEDYQELLIRVELPKDTHA